LKNKFSQKELQSVCYWREHTSIIHSICTFIHFIHLIPWKQKNSTNMNIWENKEKLLSEVLPKNIKFLCVYRIIIYGAYGMDVEKVTHIMWMEWKFLLFFFLHCCVQISTDLTANNFILRIFMSIVYIWVGLDVDFIQKGEKFFLHMWMGKGWKTA